METHPQTVAKAKKQKKPKKKKKGTRQKQHKAVVETDRMWRCPVEGCGHICKTRQGVYKHCIKTHGRRVSLTELLPVPVSTAPEKNTRRCLSDVSTDATGASSGWCNHVPSTVFVRCPILDCGHITVTKDGMRRHVLLRHGVAIERKEVREESHSLPESESEVVAVPRTSLEGDSNLRPVSAPPSSDAESIEFSATRYAGLKMHWVYQQQYARCRSLAEFQESLKMRETQLARNTE